jgi:hypothetical protein
MSPLNPKTQKSKQTTTPSHSNSTQSIIKFISRKKEGTVIAMQLSSDIDAVTKSPQHSVSEKRTYSDNETSCVKRLKLDGTDEVPIASINNKENEEIEAFIVVE